MPFAPLASDEVSGRRRRLVERWSVAAIVPAALLIGAGPAEAQSLRPGNWGVTSTVSVLAVPGLPGFIQRMARGRSKTERKRLAAGQGVDALLAPDPKAKCRIVAQRIADGRYQQTLDCPQKRGGTMRVVRAGSYDADGFTGDATVDGDTGKGHLHIVLHQQARRTGD